MSRIPQITNDNASEEQQQLFSAIQQKLGMIPNILRVFAHSTDALQAFLGLHHITEQGALSAATRERIALALAQKNKCEYCLSAHTAMGRKSGLNTEEIEANRAGDSQDAKAAVAVKFARSLLDNMGEVTSNELLEMRKAGFSEAEIVEVITHTGMNILTNMLGKASRVEIDFPRVDLQLAA